MARAVIVAAPAFLWSQLGLLSPCGAWASPCRGSFGCGPRALGRGLQWLQSSTSCLLRWQTDSLPSATREAPVSDSFRSAPVGRESYLLQCVAPSWSPSPLGPGAHPCRLLSQISEFACFCYSPPLRRHEEAAGRSGPSQGGYFFPSLSSFLGHPWQWESSPVAPLMPDGPSVVPAAHK